MNNPIKDFVKFDILGISDMISDEDKKRIKELEDRLKFLTKINPNKLGWKSKDNRPLYLIDLYSPKDQARIFNLKDRKNKNIIFSNKENNKCVIVKAFVDSQNNVRLQWHFIYNKDKIFIMTLERFLEIYSWGEFHDVYPKEFTENYLLPLEDEVKKVKDELNKYESKFCFKKSLHFFPECPSKILK